MGFQVSGRGSGELPVEPPKKRRRQLPEPREKRERQAKTDAIFKTHAQLKAEEAPITEKSGRGSGDLPVEPTKKRRRQSPEPREKRERQAKTDAIFKTRAQLKAEEAPITENETTPSRKVREGKKGAQLATAETGTGTFKVLGSGPVQKMLSFLTNKKDLQAARVEHFMDEQVVRKVKGNDIALLNRLTECLVANLPASELRDKLQNPPVDIKEALQTDNLDAYQDALYAARALFIDILSKFDSETINVLEEAFKKTGYKLPTKFENIFELARMASEGELSNEKIERLTELAEVHEIFRLIIQGGSDDRLEDIESVIGWLLRWDHDVPRVEQVDRATFRQILKFCEAQPESEKKNSVLSLVHLVESWNFILMDSYDKAVESLVKSIEYTKRYFSESTEEQAIERGVIVRFSSLMRDSQIDNKSAGKIFNLIEQEIRALPDGPKKYDSYLEMHTCKLNLYAEKGFAELQIAMNNAIEFVDRFPDMQAKYNGFEKLFDSFVDIQEAVPYIRIFNAVKAAKESDVKNALLAGIYKECIYLYNQDYPPAWGKGDFDLKAREPVEKIQDHSFRRDIETRFNLDITPF